MTTPNGTVAQRNPDRLTRVGKRPWLTLLAFVAAFLFAATPFFTGIDHWTLVTPCVVACFCSVLLFIRLLVGTLSIPSLYIFIGVLIFAISVGQQWYVVALLALAVWGFDSIVQRIVGRFIPMIDTRPAS